MENIKMTYNSTAHSDPLLTFVYIILQIFFSFLSLFLSTFRPLKELKKCSRTESSLSFTVEDERRRTNSTNDL